MNLLIIGAGAIGCLVGGKLAASGQRVTLVGRPRFAEIVNAQGLLLTGAGETQCVRALRAVGSLAEAFSRASEEYDLAILTVKSYDTATTLHELQTAAAIVQAPLSPMLSLQNGVGNEETIAAVLGRRHVIAGTITTPVQVLNPGVIQIEKPRHFIGLSQWDVRKPTARLMAIREALREAGFTVKSYRNADAMKWTKLLTNMVGNATSAILDEPPAQLFADDGLVDLEIRAWREAFAVMNQMGIAPVNLGKYPLGWLAPLIRSLPAAWLRPVLRSQVRSGRGSKMPSLQIDLSARKSQSEVAWLNGAVAQKGTALGVPTPLNSLLTETLLTLVHHPNERLSWRHNHQRLIEASR